MWGLVGSCLKEYLEMGGSIGYTRFCRFSCKLMARNGRPEGVPFKFAIESIVMICLEHGVPILACYLLR